MALAESFTAPHVDPEMASEHLQILHGSAQGLISLVLLGSEKRERHCFFSTDDIEETSYEDSQHGLQDVAGEQWNIYIACSTFKERPEKGRGNRDNVLSIPGVWADLDVKPDTEGFFHSTEEIDRYMELLPQPTIEITTGSGGKHLYWLTPPDHPLSAIDGSKLLIQWRDFLLYEAQALSIDFVQDSARIMRLAGTLRWPKGTDDHIQTPRLVEIKKVGPRCDVKELRLISAFAHQKMTVLREQQHAERSAIVGKRHEEMENQGADLNLYKAAVGRFNALQDWGSLLEKTGWTLHSDERDKSAHCRFWIRPGKGLGASKSAATDFIYSDGIPFYGMTIYSNDPSMEDIIEEKDSSEHDICSKWNYALKRLFNNDEADLYMTVVENGGTL